jgi:hypothetical protein
MQKFRHKMDWSTFWAPFLKAHPGVDLRLNLKITIRFMYVCCSRQQQAFVIHLLVGKIPHKSIFRLSSKDSTQSINKTKIHM